MKKDESKDSPGRFGLLHSAAESGLNKTFSFLVES